KELQFDFDWARQSGSEPPPPACWLCCWVPRLSPVAEQRQPSGLPTSPAAQVVEVRLARLRCSKMPNCFAKSHKPATPARSRRPIPHKFCRDVDQVLTGTR